MPERDLTPAPPHPNHGPTVLADIPCSACQYNLAGIPVSTVCPECGLRVSASIESWQRVTPSQWLEIRRALLIVISANSALLALPVVYGIADQIIPWRQQSSLPWAVAGAFAALVLLRSHGYSRLAKVLAGLHHEPNEWRAHLAIARMAMIRGVLGFFPLLFMVAEPLMGPMRDPISVTALLVYCAAGFLQFWPMEYALHGLARRAGLAKLRDSVNHHTAICIAGVFPGSFAFGLGLIVTWISYHVLLGRFVAAARRAGSSDQPE